MKKKINYGRRYIDKLRDKNYVIVEDDDDNYESQEEKGPKKFYYHADLEIINDITPKICLKRKL